MEKEKQIIENNRLIAEFMGWVLTNGFEGDIRYNVPKKVFTDPRLCYIEPARMLYHSSWDWLMPVVEKIESI